MSMDDLLAALRRLSSSQAAMDRAAAKRMNISRTDLDAIEALGRLGPLTATELAGCVGLTKSAATTLIDRIVAAGYAERVLDARDRRRVVVRPTAEAMLVSRELFGPLVERARSAFSEYEVEQLPVLLGFVNRAEALLRETAERMQDASTLPASGEVVTNSN